MISAVVLTKNEEKNILDCLEGLMFCDEIIVIDDNSEDRTVELVKNLMKKEPMVKFFSRSLNLNFSEQRKFGIEKAKYDWILFIDADERVGKDLEAEIIDSVTINTQVSGFLIPRIDFMWGKRLRHGESGRIRLLRLFNKKEGMLKGRVHETWQTNKPVGRFINPIIHYPHPTISEFLKEINFYTDLRAKELKEQGVKVNALSIVIYPEAKFFLNYFIKLGFLDGVPGFIHASLMSFHSFLVRGKLWQLNNSKK